MKDITALPKSQKCYLTNHPKFSFESLSYPIQENSNTFACLCVCFPLCIWSSYSPWSAVFYSAKMMLMKEKTPYVYAFLWLGLLCSSNTSERMSRLKYEGSGNVTLVSLRWCHMGKKPRNLGWSPSPTVLKLFVSSLILSLTSVDWWLSEFQNSLLPSCKFHFTWVNMRTDQSPVRILTSINIYLNV